MDEIKDTQLSNLSKFLDIEVRTDPFGENRSGERAYRRAERLVAALFLLTNHVDSQETLRSEIRRLATSLLQQILDLRSDMRSISSSKLQEFQATIRFLISCVKMLLFSGVISSQNADAASGALDDLGNFILASQRSSLSDSIRFSREDLNDVRSDYKGQIKDIRDRQVLKDKSPIKDMSDNQTPLIEAAIAVRGQRVMATLRSGSDFNIRDISSHLPEYSEKTIQREIASLVQRGLVRRTGLKRWSRYSIV